jgi:hypothetical protein
LHHGWVVLDEEAAAEADGEHVACEILVCWGLGRRKGSARSSPPATADSDLSQIRTL